MKMTHIKPVERHAGGNPHGVADHVGRKLMPFGRKPLQETTSPTVAYTDFAEDLLESA